LFSCEPPSFEKFQGPISKILKEPELEGFEILKFSKRLAPEIL
jgi:hypothetical protein